MKISVLILVVSMLWMANTDETVDAKQMSQWIKARGTFSVSLVNLDETSNGAA